MYKHIIISFLIFVGVFFATPVFAASISAVPSVQSVHEGQTFSVDVFLDPQNESINTVSAEVQFSDNLTYVSSTDNNSIVGEWVESPALLSSKYHVVHFSALIPGGFAGYIDPFSPSSRKSGLLVHLVFTASVSGPATISFNNFHAYINDGNGTEATVLSSDLHMIVEKGATLGSKEIQDTHIPDVFVPVLVHDPLLFNGKYSLVFSAKDSGSGINHYEIKEGNGNWIRAQSPYVIQDQYLSVPMWVKAVDGVGNERVVSVVLPFIDSSHQVVYNCIAVFVVFVLLYVIIVWKRWITHKKHTK